MKAEIADDIESHRKILVEHFCVETDLLFGRERIEHSANRIHFARDVLSGTAFGPFEHHVLDEVRDAVFLRDFAARAIANPHADGDGADVRHRLGNDHQTVGEHVPLNVAHFRCHAGSVTQGGGG